MVENATPATQSVNSPAAERDLNMDGTELTRAVRDVEPFSSGTRRDDEAKLRVLDATAYRIFLSYSHQDKDLVGKVVQILKDIGLVPMWDRDFAYGAGFHDQIKIFIEHAHVFMPILTTTSDTRNWVHQEIGFAMAHNIPVLPIAVDKLPDEMIRHIQALQVDRAEIDELRTRLTRSSVTTVIERQCSRQSALYTCADTSERRAAMMRAYAKDVSDLGYAGMVRQKGGLSSFHIPAEPLNNPVWKKRYGSYAHSEEHCRLQRGERLALTVHAQAAGSRLIVNPYLDYGAYGDLARMVRLGCLLTFLQGMSDDLCAVAIHDNMKISESVTLVGNWYSAALLSKTGSCSLK